jgi:hypothetical protein
MRLRLFIISVLVTTLVGGQILNKGQEHVIRETIEETYGPIDANFIYNQGFNTNSIVGTDTLYNPNGYYFVFKLSQGKATRLDRCTFHGGNFHRFLFSWKKRLHALGGYGFFTTTNNLLYFNQITGGWTFQPTGGNTPPHLLGANFKKGKYIYTFNNYQCGNSTGEDVFDFKLHRLDLDKMHWKTFTLLDTNLFFKGFSYSLKNYVFFKGEDQSIIIHPNTMEYLIVKNEEIGFPYSHQILDIHSNSITIRHIDSVGVKNCKTIDLETIWKSFTIHNKFKYESSTIVKSNLSWSTLFIVALIGLILILLYLLVKKNKTAPMLQSYTESHLLLMNQSKNLLTQEEFDSIMGIDVLEQDSKKLKRHRIITDLNQTHPNFVERIKDEMDKRRNLYKINK